MTLLKNLAIGLCALVAILTGVGFALPDSAHLERSITVSARPLTVFTVLDGYKLFNRWSPWAELDPHTVYAFMGPDSGVGAKLSWDSENPDVGSGNQEIIESTPVTQIRQRLAFNDFDTENTATFTLTPVDGGTRIVWSYDSAFKGSLLYRYFGLMLDKMVGPDYEHGLARLKTLLESLPQEDFSTLKVEQIDAKPIIIAYTQASSARNAEGIGAALGEAYVKRIGPFLKSAGLTQTGAPLAIYGDCEAGKPACMFRAGIPVDRADAPVPEDSPVKLGQTDAGKMLHVVHTGPYKGLPRTYAQLQAYMAARGLEAGGAPLEQYVSDPSQTPQENLRTDIYLPLK